MANGVWKGVYPQVFGCFDQSSLNMSLYSSTPFMINIDNVGKKWGGEKIMMEIVTTLSCRQAKRDHLLCHNYFQKALLLKLRPIDSAGEM